MKQAEASSALAQTQICIYDPGELAPVGLSRGRGHVHPRISHPGRRNSAHNAKLVHSQLQRSTNQTENLKLDPQSPTFSLLDLAFYRLIVSVTKAFWVQYHATERRRSLSWAISTKSQRSRHKRKYSEIENVERYWSDPRVHLGYKFEEPFGSSPELFLMDGTPRVNAAKIHELSSERVRRTGESSDIGSLWAMEFPLTTRPPCGSHNFSSRGLGAGMRKITFNAIGSSELALIASKLIAFTSPTDPLEVLKISPRQHIKFLPLSQKCEIFLSDKVARRNSSGRFECYPHSADPPIHLYNITLRKNNKQTNISQQNTSILHSTGSRQREVVSSRATVIPFTAYVHLVQQTARIIIELRNSTLAVYFAIAHSVQLFSMANEHQKTAEVDHGYHDEHEEILDEGFLGLFNSSEDPQADYAILLQMSWDPFETYLDSQSHPIQEMPLAVCDSYSTFSMAPLALERHESPESFNFEDWVDLEEPSCVPSPVVLFEPDGSTSPPALYHSSAPTAIGTPEAPDSPPLCSFFRPRPPAINMMHPAPATIAIPTAAAAAATLPPLLPPVQTSSPSPPLSTMLLPSPKLYPCPYPGCPRKDFERPCDQRKHSKIHQKIYTCDVRGCPRSEGFSSKKDVRRHKETVHEKKRSFVCHLCKKAHSRKDNLMEHEKRHKQEMGKRGRAARSPK